MSSGTITKREGKRGDSWLLRWYYPDPQTGKRRQLYKTVKGSKADARRELNAILSSIDKGEAVAPSKLTLRAFADQWVSGLEGRGDRIGARTLQGYGDWLRLHVMPTLGDMELQKITGAQIDALYSRLLTAGYVGPRRKSPGPARGLSPRTVLHVHRTLFLMLKAATRLRLIPRNVAEDVDAPRPDKAAQHADRDDENIADLGEVKFFEPAECAALLEAFTIRAGEVEQGDYFRRSMHPLVVLALNSGCRRGELLALRWRDVDLDTGMVSVRGAIEKTKKRGIRAKAGAKNKSSLRTINISPEACAILRRHRNDQRELALRLGAKYPDDCLLFPDILQGGAVSFTALLDPDEVSREFAKVMARAGLAGRTFHSLRHTHATLLIDAGVPIPAVSKRLGHSSIATTIKTYAHATTRAADKGASVAADIMRAALRT